MKTEPESKADRRALDRIRFGSSPLFSKSAFGLVGLAGLMFAFSFWSWRSGRANTFLFVFMAVNALIMANSSLLLLRERRAMRNILDSLEEEKESSQQQAGPDNS